MTNFGNFLRRCREQQGLTLEELAERAGVSVSLLSLVERGKRSAPNLKRLERLATALSIDVDNLITQAKLDAGMEVEKKTGRFSDHSEVVVQKKVDDAITSVRAARLKVYRNRNTKGGAELLNLEEVGERLLLLREVGSENFFYFEVSDDSMSAEGIKQGALALIRPTTDRPHGSVVLVKFRNATRSTLRRIYYEANGEIVIFIATDPKVIPKVIRRSELDDKVQILGQAVRIEMSLTEPLYQELRIEYDGKDNQDT